MNSYYTCPYCYLMQRKLYNHKRHMRTCVKRGTKQKPHCSFCQIAGHVIHNHVCLACAEGYIKCGHCVYVHAKNEKVRLPHKCKRKIGKGRVQDSAFSKKIESYKILPDVNFNSDVLMFLGNKKREIIDHIKERLQLLKGVKYYMTLHLNFIKFLEDGNIKKISQYLRAKTKFILNDIDIETTIADMCQDLNEKVQIFCREGSGWLFEKVNFITVDTVMYKPLSGGKYKILPQKLARSKFVLNIESIDDTCFELCLAAALYPVSQNRNRAASYRGSIHKIMMGNISHPVSMKDIPRVEEMNEVKINVFDYDDNVLPVYLSQKTYAKEVNLLLYDNHYFLITNIHSFLSSILGYSSKSGKHFFCLNCLQKFKTEQKLKEHQILCLTHKAQILRLPSDDKKTVKFKNWEKKLFSPVVIYYDTEAYLRKVNDEKVINRHEINSFAMLIVWRNQMIKPKLILYKGEGVIDEFMRVLQREYEIIHSILSNVEPMNILSDFEKAKLMQEKVCSICLQPFSVDDKPHIDHDHLTGSVRGLAHAECNLKFSFKKKGERYEIPVIAHGGSSYDLHHIIQNLHGNANRKITCVPHTAEKYLAFNIDNFKFIDSNNFLNASLRELSKMLDKEQCGMMKEIFGDNYELLLEKSIYPYTKASEELMLATKLPDISSFYDDLNDQPISEKDYERAQVIWKKMKLKTFSDYHDLYLKSDVVILACVSEHFRDICEETLALDPWHYLSLPGLSWDAMLSFNDIKFDLITDIDQYNMVESSIRGGISGIYTKYLSANNPYLHDYDPSMPTSYILFLDACNLYATGLRSLLPKDGFRFLTEDEIAAFDIQSHGEWDGKGFFICADLEIPDSLHDMFNGYPPVASREQIKDDMLSDVTKRIRDKIGMNYRTNTSRLVQTLYPKERYVCHYAILKYFIRLGIKVTKIHKILEFNQEAYMRDYVDHQSEMRKHAKSAVEVNLRKALINILYGKSIQDKKKCKSVHFVNSEKQLLKLAAKSNYVSGQIYKEDLVSVMMKQRSVLLDKPISIGATVLDLTKLHMLRFYYGYLLPKYGFDNVEVGMSDTDSFLIRIETENDVYQDMRRDAPGLFDLSNYAENSDMFSEQNKRKPGYFKDEEAAYYPHLIPSEFVGLCSKSYSLQLARGKHKTRNKASKHQRMACKGVKKNIARRKFSHDLFKLCLLNDQVQKVKTKHIRSRKHQVYTQTEEKIALSSYDSKRFVTRDKFSTFAFGHWRIRNGKKKNQLC